MVNTEIQGLRLCKTNRFLLLFCGTLHQQQLAEFINVYCDDGRRWEQLQPRLIKRKAHYFLLKVAHFRPEMGSTRCQQSCKFQQSWKKGWQPGSLLLLVTMETFSEGSYVVGVLMESKVLSKKKPSIFEKAARYNLAY